MAPDRPIRKARGALIETMPPGVARCRREIETAIRNQRNVIPVTWPRFEWPDKDILPDSIRELPDFESVPYSHEGFDATISKLESFLDDQD